MAERWARGCGGSPLLNPTGLVEQCCSWVSPVAELGLNYWLCTQMPWVCKFGQKTRNHLFSLFLTDLSVNSAKTNAFSVFAGFHLILASFTAILLEIPDPLPQEMHPEAFDPTKLLVLKKLKIRIDQSLDSYFKYQFAAPSFYGVGGNLLEDLLNKTIKYQKDKVLPSPPHQQPFAALLVPSADPLGGRAVRRARAVRKVGYFGPISPRWPRGPRELLCSRTTRLLRFVLSPNTQIMS